MLKRNIEDNVFDVFPRLETERLVLRQIGMADRAAIFRIYSDPEVMRYSVGAQFQHIGEAERLIGEIKAQFERRASLQWGICLQDRGTVIGLCTLYNWQRVGVYAGSCSLAYEIARPYWKRGYANEVLRAIIQFGFEIMQLNRIEVNVISDVYSERSETLLRSLNFRLEGVLRERGYWNGEYHDLHHYALLRREWVLRQVVSLCY